SAASTTATSMPASRRCSAVDRPVKPAPMITTSASAVPSSCVSAGPCGVTAAHNDSGHRTSVGFIVRSPLRFACWREPFGEAAKDALGQEDDEQHQEQAVDQIVPADRAGAEGDA